MDNQNRVCFDSGDSAPNRRERVTHSVQQQRNNEVREVQVTGFAEDSCQTDRVTLRIRVKNSKASVSDASSSVSERLKYIQQTLTQLGVASKDVSVRRYIHREGDVYHMEAEATVEFWRCEGMDNVCCVLLEKLGKSVSIGTPRYHHSTESLSKLRCGVCLTAVENAQQKASDMSRLLKQTLGPPLLVREVETQEWLTGEEKDEEDQEEEDDDGVKRHRAAARFVAHRRPVARASSRVSVTFKFLDTAKKL